MRVNEYLPGTIGERIKDLLSEKKMSHAKLAKAIHISEATMSRYINGTSEIPCDVLLGIARFFNVTTDFLLGATNIPYKTNFDIDKLGLTEAAAKKLLSGALNMDVLNKLLINEDFAILTGRLSGIRTLKAQGVEKIIFVTKGATSAFMLSDLLEKGESGDTYKLTHDGKAVTFTLGEKMTDVSAILTKP